MQKIRVVSDDLIYNDGKTDWYIVSITTLGITIHKKYGTERKMLKWVDNDNLVDPVLKNLERVVKGKVGLIERAEA